MSRTITQAEKLQLLGLVTLGRRHNKIASQVSDAITEIIGTDDSQVHDATWEQDADFEEALKNSGIEVEDATT
jgi:hypothetical protein